MQQEKAPRRYPTFAAYKVAQQVRDAGAQAPFVWTYIRP